MKKFIALILAIAITACATTRAPEVYNFDAVVTCKGDNCSEDEARRFAHGLAQAAIPPADDAATPSWVWPTVAGVSLVAVAGGALAIFFATRTPEVRVHYDAASQ